MTFPIQPKYSIGQQVYGASAERRHRWEKCPDCLGTLEWTVTTPGGDEFLLPCNTCQVGFERKGAIAVYEERPVVQPLTIGSVRLDTNDAEHPITYMCQETGVGSGTLHRETNLFPTYEEAKEQATKLAAERTARWNEEERQREERRRKESRRKPSYEDRQIRELTKVVKELRAEVTRLRQSEAA